MPAGGTVVISTFDIQYSVFIIVFDNNYHNKSAFDCICIGRKETKPFKIVCGEGRLQAAPMVRCDKL